MAHYCRLATRSRLTKSPLCNRTSRTITHTRPYIALSGSTIGIARPAAIRVTSFPISDLGTGIGLTPRNLHCAMTSTSANSRLSLISRHLHSSPPQTLTINTPYSAERQTASEDTFNTTQTPSSRTQSTHAGNTSPQRNMSSQEPHPAVLIPGPIEYDDEVLKSMSHYRCD